MAPDDETRVLSQESETRVPPSERWTNPDRVQLALAFVAGVCLTLAVGGFIFYFADLEIRDDSQADSVLVPNVLGQSTYDAEIELRIARLQPRNDFSPLPQNTSVFDTTVKLQSPPPGTRVKPGSTVQLQIE